MFYANNGIQSPLYSKLMYVFWDLYPPYQRITPDSTLNRSNTTSYPRKRLAPVLSISCKNAQKTTYIYNHAVILYYCSMFCYPGIFTFSITAVFSPGQGCVPLKRRPPNLNHRFYAHFINCVNFSHNSP